MTRRWPVLAVGLIVPAILVGQAPAPTIADPFEDVTTAAGLTFVHQSGATPEKRMFETFGSGVAWLDFDDDGWQDLFFTNGTPGAPNALYRNNGDGTFSDVTSRTGVAGDGPDSSVRTGVAVGDIDRDGDLDLYVAALGPNLLYRNNGDGTFTDVTAASGTAGGPTEWSTSVGFFDADRDGHLDLYVANYLDVRPGENPYCGFMREGYRMYCSPTHFDGVADRLFHNNGDGTFSDVSAAAGIANPAGKGLGVTFCDIDADADTDIYVANDLVRNFLYRNNGDGTFADATYGAGVGFDANGKPQAGMGTDCADVDGNGLPDLFVTNYADELNTLYVNRGEAVFEDVSTASGLGSGFLPLGFGTRLYDVDNDGDLDIHVTNGHVIDNVTLYNPDSSYEQPDLLYENAGDGRFLDVSAQGGPALATGRVGRGLAVADYDNDGDLDVVVTNVGGTPDLLRNRGTTGHHWLTIRPRGRTSNTLGLGARVVVEAGDTRRVFEVNNAASYLSANDVRLHIGLGPATSVDRLTIMWPGGTVETLDNVAADQFLDVEEP